MKAGKWHNVENRPMYNVYPEYIFSIIIEREKNTISCERNFMRTAPDFYNFLSIIIHIQNAILFRSHE